jgi:hypothetical protein
MCTTPRAAAATDQPATAVVGNKPCSMVLAHSRHVMAIRDVADVNLHDVNDVNV